MQSFVEVPDSLFLIPDSLFIIPSFIFLSCWVSILSNTFIHIQLKNDKKFIINNLKLCLAGVLPSQPVDEYQQTEFFK